MMRNRQQRLAPSNMKQPQQLTGSDSDGSTIQSSIYKFFAFMFETWDISALMYNFVLFYDLCSKCLEMTFAI